MNEKHEGWLLRAVNDILGKTRGFVERFERLEERLERIEDSLEKRAAPPARDVETISWSAPGEAPGAVSTSTPATMRVAAPPPDEPEEVEEKSPRELLAAFIADPKHCPQCGVRLKRKVAECQKCGLTLPKRGSALKKILVTLLVLGLLLGGAGVALHLTGRLPALLERVPGLKGRLPAWLSAPGAEPEPESGPAGPQPETAPPTTETPAPAG